MKSLSQIAKENGRDVSEFAGLPSVYYAVLEDYYEERLNQNYNSVDIGGIRYPRGTALRKVDPSRFNAGAKLYAEDGHGEWCIDSTSPSAITTYIRMSDVEKVLASPPKKKVFVVITSDADEVEVEK